MKLRLDLPYLDLATRYSISITTIQNVFLTYLHACHEIFFVGCMCKIPSLEKNKASLPGSFGDIANCRVILTGHNSKLKHHGKIWKQQGSPSVSTNITFLHLKYLIGVVPNGAVTFISEGFPGRASDKMITDQSKIISHLKVCNYGAFSHTFV